MNLQEACQAADLAVFTKSGRHLSDVQKLILRGALQGQTYEQIAESSNYAVSYLKKYVGHSLWKQLSEALGEKVSKTNFREALERGCHRCKVKQTELDPSLPQAQPQQAPTILVGVPALPVFFGRTDELTRLEQWLTEDDCRLILLSGMGGIGKTALAATLAQQLQSNFEYILWQSLREAPPVKDVVNHLNKFFAERSEADSKSHSGGEVLQLTEYLRKYRSLLILDNVESILCSGEIAGQYREHYQNYGTLIRELTTESHQSCLLLISREQPAEIAAQAGDSLPIRSLRVKNLLIEDAKSLLETKGISRLERGIEDLIQLYRGNPSILQIVSTTIKELFNGNVAQFLKQNTILLDDLALNLIQEQFERLSALEKGVIYGLALEEKPISLSRLKENSKFLVATGSELMKLLQSLKRRSFLEEERRENEDEAVFALQPTLKKHAVNKFIEQICKDLLACIETRSPRKMGLLKTHLLLSSSHLQNATSSNQNFLAPKLILEKLAAMLNSEIHLKMHLQEILISLEKKMSNTIGYAMTNLLYLLEHVEA